MTDEEVTRVTCPRCDGSGQVERREDVGTTYLVSTARCWLCLGLQTVVVEDVRKWTHHGRPLDRPVEWR